MDDNTERRLRDADPLTRRTNDGSRDQEWLRDTARSAASRPPRSTRRRGVAWIGAAAAVVLAATAGGLLLRGGDEPAATMTQAAPTVTDLTVPVGDAMPICIAFSEEELGKAPVAFSGEVTEKAGDEVLLDVETWYRGGDSEQVRLTSPDFSQTSLGDYGVDFQVGSRYLVSADSGTVRTCGFTVPWSAEMEGSWQAAFGS